MPAQGSRPQLGQVFVEQRVQTLYLDGCWEWRHVFWSMDIFCQDTALSFRQRSRHTRQALSLFQHKLLSFRYADHFVQCRRGSWALSCHAALAMLHWISTNCVHLHLTSANTTKHKENGQFAHQACPYDTANCMHLHHL